MAKQYIGQKEVSEYNEIEGNVHYTLSDGSGDIVTSEQFASMHKPEPYDDGLIRINKWSPAITEIMAVLLKNNMRVIEKQFVLGRVDETIIDSYDRASAKLYGTDYEHNINLRHIHDVLTKGQEMIDEEVVEVAASESETPAEEVVAEEVVAAEEVVEETAPEAEAPAAE